MQDENKQMEWRCQGVGCGSAVGRQAKATGSGESLAHLRGCMRPVWPKCTVMARVVADKVKGEVGT